MQNIMVVMEKNGFIARAMVDQLKELEYNVVATELDVQLLAKLNDTYEAVLLYIEGEIEEKTPGACISARQSCGGGTSCFLHR